MACLRRQQTSGLAHRLGNQTSRAIPVRVRPHASGPLVLAHKPNCLCRTPSALPLPVTFHDHVCALSRWEHRLLERHKIFLRPLQAKRHYIVSDGSQIGDRVTFGWVFGSDDGKVYAEHAHFGFGTPTSHWAEAWGYLSALTFLVHLQQYINIPLGSLAIPSTVVFSDNSGLVQRMNQRRPYKTVYPNSTLAPDWDLVEQIHQATTPFAPDLVQFRWVKGHQDDDHTNLTTEARYNIRAFWQVLSKSLHISPHLASQGFSQPQGANSFWTKVAFTGTTQLKSAQRTPFLPSSSTLRPDISGHPTSPAPSTGRYLAKLLATLPSPPHNVQN